ncbi:MAG: 50S ribosomal protein L4 [Gammaproteobacteria bacterium]|nr:50S ribosomal protein L4 [Gammaproteobacteria bacterium]
MTVELAVLKSDGKPASSLEVSDAAFGADFNEPLIHQVVTAYLAGARSGTRAQKNRAAVRGGGTKPWRQKGTGRARSGTIRSPIWRGGGKVFPASTRDFGQKVNRKMFRAGLRSIFSEMARQGRVTVCDDVLVSEPRTKGLAALLKSLEAGNSVIVTHVYEQNLWLAARNLHRVNVCEAREVDPVVLVGHEKVVMTSEAVKQIEEWLQ